MPTSIHPVRTLFVNFYLIEWDDELVLIDGGFTGGIFQLEKILKSINKSFLDIRLILLTHGHLDHTLNIRFLKEQSGAQVACHPADKLHVAGKYPYVGSAKICGMLESAGRKIFNYQTFETEIELKDNQRIEDAGGIRVIHLPGHTKGHCGFYHEPTGILFTGDFYQYSWYREGFAPFFLNSCPEHFPASIEKILQLNPKGIYSNHSDDAPPEIQYQRFKDFVTYLKK